MDNHLILIVEDDDSIRSVITFFLELEGFIVEAACNGKDAFDKLQNLPQNPCIILLDLMMPVMNGYEFIDQISRYPEWNSIPLVVMTAGSSQMRQNLTVPTLQKPLDLDCLVSILKGYCH